MPRLDGTGPAGAGPGTGRGLGRCGAAARRGLDSAGGVGRGGMPRGEGRGRFFGGARFRGVSGALSGGPSLSPANESESLRAELSAAKEELAVLKARLAELERQNQAV